MSTQGERAAKLIRTSVLVPETTDAALRALAEKGQRPLSWEIRRALEAHVERQASKPLDSSSGVAA
jgi:predicted transcriptional regulator